MSMTQSYSADAPTMAAIEALTRPTLLEFGTDWCGHCRAAQPLIASAFESHPDLDHIKVEDGKGRPLGRAFGVKLWPTLIFLDKGKEVARLVRPTEAQAIEQACAALVGSGEKDGSTPAPSVPLDEPIDDRPQFEDEALGDLLGTPDSESTSRGEASKT